MKPVGWLLFVVGFWVLVYRRMMWSACAGNITCSSVAATAVWRSKCWGTGAAVAIAGGGRVRGGMGAGVGASNAGNMGNVWFGVRLGLKFLQ